MAIMGVLLIGINVKVIVHVQMRLLRFKTLVIPFTIPLFLLILPLMKFLKFWIIQRVDYLEMGLMEEIVLLVVASLTIFRFIVEVIQLMEEGTIPEVVLFLL
jgi:hypothetical protein